MSTTLRHAEYYDMQKVFDDLYQRSENNATKGINLYKHIISKENILLAYRNIKANTGSKTEGTDGITIDHYKMEKVDSFVDNIRKTLEHYKPNTVRRVEIPKSNGKKRPLGIPTMRDRLIQQMFKQVLEPICEAKFYKHSYGFRPNRSTHHAMARCQYLINRGRFNHVVDIDIQGFFDNVNHSKLLKQLYNIGITDKRVLTIISKMLKAPIKGEGIPTKGTPQGGILSPLLSNVVLNDLDWWISSQWENIKTRKPYTTKTKNPLLIKAKLKKMHIVRYADDFKIFTNNHQSATKIFYAVEGYLKNQLNLNISNEKSTITNLKRKSSDFLGFSIKSVKKRKRYVANTHVSEKKKKDILEKAKTRIKAIQKSPSGKTVQDYNSYVLGIKNYYKIATHVNIDFAEIAFRLSKTLFNRLKSIGKYEIPINANRLYKRLHRNNYRTFEIAGNHVYPLADIQTRFPQSFSQGMCHYTREGRQKLIESLKGNIANEIQKMLLSSNKGQSMEYTDNRISRYSMQNGKCAVTGIFLTAEDVHCHHKIPRGMGGTDEFNNLIIVHEFVHRLIHATNEETIKTYMRILQLSDNQLKKINKLRKACNLVTLV
ncbi:group II intron reverse transcriptase/maturase [Bacillus thuringiensis]|uniref:group II intron reverse transcriptase/maturase n=1 Tax=Bacillus thuringiensis TaxID=1428 RepID=UPI002D7FA1AE|nr:group II intron reverse transcriptase/maturase [Bacillus thuringiensis]MEB4819762.1 group II intron reverse transcriptase/maturase [Bacillus thuringiensis]